MRLRLSTYRDFSSIALITFASIYCKTDVTWTDEITRVVRHKWTKIGAPYLISENGDLSFLLYFSKQCLAGNIRGKFKKIIR